MKPHYPSFVICPLNFLRGFGMSYTHLQSFIGKGVLGGWCGGLGAFGQNAEWKPIYFFFPQIF